MYAITLQQPWAWAVFHAGKDVENRTWKIPLGRILIHAGRAIDQDGIDFMEDVMGIEMPYTKLNAMARGKIIGSVEVVNVSRGRHKSPWAVRGQFHHDLARPRLARRQIAVRGTPGLWRPPEGWEQSVTRKAS